MRQFNFASTPHIHFGVGQRAILPDLIRRYGSRLVLVSGGHSFDASSLCQGLLESLNQQFQIMLHVRVSGEPTPALVDHAVAACFKAKPDCVIAIGGGSPVDTAKAIAGLLPSGDSVMQYLEGVGLGKTYHGPSTPLIALPTTAGTGGETSKNAVLSEIGPNGFKKSFRHEVLVAKHIILDPELTLSCPASVTAACGMDALTQLLESYVSKHANPMSDALALSGMQTLARSLPTAISQGDDLPARSDMLYAASMSGLTLANAGLGSVHGLASPIGAYFPMPHGEVCGSLLYEATRLNITLMQNREPENIALNKYAEAGRMILDDPSLDHDAALAGLLSRLKSWTDAFNMPLLSDYGITATDADKLIANASPGSMQTNPILLSDAETATLIQSRLG